MSAERNLNDTELLSAYIDDQLTIEERSVLDSRLQTDAELRHQLALLRATVDLIKELPQLEAPRDFTLTPGMVRVERNNRRIYGFSLLSAAAAIVLLFIGFGLLSIRTQQAASGYSRADESFPTDVVGSQVALLPTSTALSTQASPETSMAVPELFLQEDTEQGAGIEPELTGEQMQQAQATLTQIFMSTAPAAIQAPPAMEAADEFDDTATSTIAEETADDGRLRDTQQAETQSEAAQPASPLPYDAVAQPTQESAGGMLAFQATTAPPSPTPMPTQTAIPTQTTVPTPPAQPVAADPSVILGVALIVVAVILLGAAVAAIVINRRR